jgi:hypothetical protein
LAVPTYARSREKVRPRRLNRLIQFHEDPTVISAWMSLAAPALTWLTPARRRSLLVIGAVWVVFEYLLPSLVGVAQSSKAIPVAIRSLSVILILMAFLWGCYRLALRFSALPPFIRRNPQLCLHAVFWGLLVLLWTTSSGGVAWRLVVAGVVIMLPFFLWRLGYLLSSAQRGRVAGTRFRDHMFYLWPIWGGSNTPFGKGLDYLARSEAKDEESLARAQLAGLRLFVLAGIWYACLAIMNGLVFGVNNAVRMAAGGITLGVPRLDALIDQGKVASIPMAWAAVYCDLFRDVLHRAANGHVIIGILRLFGFYVFRNTYKPLLSESVVGFWNRYYYYFKEIMADFFFFPTFARWFRKRPVVRLFAAVFMAAFVGNMYYHLIRMGEELAKADFQTIWLSLHARLFYCFLLAAGIFISMLREQKRTRKSRGIARRAMAIFGVWTMFALIGIWNEKCTATFLPKTWFFLGLFGLD